GPDTPPAAPAAVGDVLIPGSGPGPTIGAHDEDVELVGIARHGGDSAARRGHAVEDAPPTTPLSAGDVLVPGSGPDSTIGADHEDVELVGTARDGGDSAARRSHSTGDVPPTAPLRVVHVLVPGGRVDSAVGAHEEDVELVGIA